MQVDTSTGWGRRLLTGVFQYTKKRPNWDIWTSPKSFAEVQNLPSGMYFDGAIAYIGNERQARAMATYNIPTVNASVFDTEPHGIPNVPPDKDAPTELAFNFFRKRGYRHYAYCGPIGKPHILDYAERFKKQVESAGYDCWLVNTNGKSLSDRLAALPVPCAIMAWPRTVYQLLAASHALNRKIPEDFPILVQDEDDILNQLSTPPLSAILVPAEQIGQEAAHLLHLMMEGKPLPKVRTIPRPRDIIERQSTNAMSIEDEDIRTILHFIRTESHRPCTIDSIADLTNCSRRTLERRFQKLFGRTIAEEIQATRLERARAMLNETDLPVAQIAPLCGFSSAEYFIYVFRKAHNMTPITFRNHNRGLIHQPQGHASDS